MNDNEHRNYTFLEEGNRLYDRGWLKQGSYVLILINNLDEEILVYGYVLMSRVYGSRLPQLVNKEVFGVKHVQYPIGIADYGIYVDEKKQVS